MPLQATSGAASQDAFGGNGVAVVPTYIEDIFSCFLYTGNGSTQTITNGIDLSTKGGLVWTKNRIQTYNHTLIDSANGVGYQLESNTTTALVNGGSSVISSFNSDGFSVGNAGRINYVGNGIVSWTFRKQPKFFDVVTWTADNSGTGQAVPHNLGSIPGCIIVKATNASSNWFTWHISTGITVARTGFQLNSTAASALSVNSIGGWTSTEFFSGQLFDSGFDRPVTDGTTYVAYLFAHDAGGFGLTGNDNVISCGSFTTDGAGAATVSLGYEPQWVMTKSSSGTSAWRMFDTMRGLTVAGQNDALLQAQSSAAEITNTDYCSPTATGFTIDGHSGSATHIYIAIRRGPMKVPTTGTSVFSPVVYTGNGGTQNLTTNFAGDMAWIDQRTDAGQRPQSFDKLRGGTQAIYQSSTSAEETNSSTSYTVTFNNTQTVLVGPYSQNGIYNNSGSPQIAWNFKRAPSFFDEICYTGTGSARTVTHNLATVPELMIVKCRSSAALWLVYSSATGSDYYSVLNTTAAKAQDTAIWNNTTPTASVFSLGNGWVEANQSGDTYVAYLFATCAGVSKVGSYTGTGTTKQIDCGFTAGARFVLIKRTDSTGDWYVWDSARGIIAGNDPYLLLNSTAAEVTNTDYIDTYSAGFEISSTAPAAINASAGTFIFLAIA